MDSVLSRAGVATLRGLQRFWRCKSTGCHLWLIVCHPRWGFCIADRWRGDRRVALEYTINYSGDTAVAPPERQTI